MYLRFIDDVSFLFERSVKIIIRHPADTFTLVMVLERYSCGTKKNISKQPIYREVSSLYHCNG